MSFFQEKDINSLALAPFLDMFNHSNDADVEVNIDIKNNAYILKTLRSYKKYDQVFIKYGSHSSHKLLLEYGFTLSRNPNDFVKFSYDEILRAAKNYDCSYGKASIY